MDFYQVNGFKKVSISKIIENYNDIDVLCPYCNNLIDQNYKKGEFSNKEGDYVSIECNHCFKICAIKFHHD